MKLPATDLLKQFLGASFTDCNQPSLRTTSPTWRDTAQWPAISVPSACTLQPLHWPSSRLWSGFYALADAAYLDGAGHYPSITPAAEPYVTLEADTFAVTTLQDGLKAAPTLLMLNTALGVCLSVRPWLDEAIALEQQASETGKEPQHRSPWPDVKCGLLDGVRWFVREWLIKFVVRPRLEEVAVARLPGDEARKLLFPLRPHLELVRAIGGAYGWPLHRRLAALLEAALYSGALLKAADLVYTAAMLGVVRMGLERSSRPSMAWYVRELRAALLRCSITWGAGAACAALFALVDHWPVTATLGHFAGETFAGMFLYPLVMQSVA